MTERPENPSKALNPFGALVGLAFASCEKGFSRFVLEVRDALMNPHRVLHGGAFYAMADTGMGHALYTLLGEGEMCATVEVKINYFGPVRSGTLTCDTRVVHKGRKLATLESEVRNGEWLVAKALGTYYIFTPQIS